MRGAGCTINDMWDRDIDSKVSPHFSGILVWGSNELCLWVIIVGLDRDNICGNRILLGTYKNSKFKNS